MFSSFNFSKLNKAERRAIRHCTSIDEQLQRKLKRKKKKKRKRKKRIKTETESSRARNEKKKVLIFAIIKRRESILFPFVFRVSHFLSFGNVGFQVTNLFEKLFILILILVEEEMNSLFTINVFRKLDYFKVLNCRN